MKVGVVVLFEGEEIDKIPEFLKLVEKLYSREQIEKEAQSKETIVIPKKKINQILDDAIDVLRQSSNYSETTILSYKNWIKSFLKWMFRSGKYGNITLDDMLEYAQKYSEQKGMHLVNLYSLAIAVDKLGKQKSIEVLNKLKKYLERNRYLALYFYTADLEEIESNKTFRRYRSAIEAVKAIKLQEEEERARETEESKSFFRRLVIDEKNVLDGILR